jgi:hypothetical protein
VCQMFSASVVSQGTGIKSSGLVPGSWKGFLCYVDGAFLRWPRAKGGRCKGVLSGRSIDNGNALLFHGTPFVLCGTLFGAKQAALVKPLLC